MQYNKLSVIGVGRRSRQTRASELASRATNNSERREEGREGWREKMLIGCKD